MTCLPPPRVRSLFHHPDLLLSPSKGSKTEPDITSRRSPCLPTDQTKFQLAAGHSADPPAARYICFTCVPEGGKNRVALLRSYTNIKYLSGARLRQSVTRAGCRSRALASGRPAGGRRKWLLHLWWGPWSSWRRPGPRRAAPPVRTPQLAASVGTELSKFSPSWC